MKDSPAGPTWTGNLKDFLSNPKIVNRDDELRDKLETTGKDQRKRGNSDSLTMHSPSKE